MVAASHGHNVTSRQAARSSYTLSSERGDGDGRALPRHNAHNRRHADASRGEGENGPYRQRTARRVAAEDHVVRARGNVMALFEVGGDTILMLEERCDVAVAPG